MPEVAPIFLTEARRLVGQWHRHNRPPVSGLFAVCVEEAGEIVGVAIVGRCVARGLDGRFTCEITRVATQGAYNACSQLYGACSRAAKALGYRTIYTYTLASETGASLRAAGFEREKELPARETWSCKARQRVQTDLFGEATRPAEAKVRWIRRLSAPK